MNCLLCEDKERREQSELCNDCSQELYMMEEMREVLREEYEEELLKEAANDKSLRVYDEYSFYHKDNFCA